MTIIDTFIPIGLGDLIYVKAMLEPVKHNFEQINITLHKELINVFRGNSSGYNDFLDQMGSLLFGSPPYTLGSHRGIFRSPMQLANDYSISLQKPDLSNLLCKGTSLNLDIDYIVLTTKIRYFSQTKLAEVSESFWKTINLLAQKYKIVILGERIVEMNQEYIHHTAEHIYSIYKDIIKNIPTDKLIDLSIPALGITSSNLDQVQQDCLIMKEAKLAITLGVGGNFCMTTAVANTVGYRADEHDIFEIIYNKFYPNAMITKNWDQFIQLLEQYL